jgi:serine/threonine protein kinase
VRFALDVAWGLEFLHENGIVHRDVKTSNVLIDNKWRAVLCDMSFACHRYSSTRMDYSCGTEAYMSPEIILAMDCDISSDVFSFGIILCAIITGREPSSDFLQR